MLKKVAAALVLTAGFTGPALADPKDYTFTAVEDHVAASKASTIQVRLIHLPSQKPVANAIIFQPKLEMPMAGMAPMATSVKAGTPDGSGVYPFIGDLSMAGPWTLSLSAKVPGESGTITGSLPIMAGSTGHGH